MKRSKKQFEQRDSAASAENTQQKGYLFAGMMILAGIVVALISAAVHRSKEGQPVISSSVDYVADNVTMWAGAELPSPYSFLYKRTSILVSDARYLMIPDMSVGDHDVAILVQLKDGTTRTENSVLTVKDSVMNMEAGTVATVEELLGENFAGATVEPPLSDFKEIGLYSVKVTQKDGREIPFKLQVLDSTPPIAVIRQNLSFYINQDVKAEDFIEIHRQPSR